MTEILRFGILGITSGALTALMALGIVLVYRGSGVVNFANGALGLWSAIVFYKLGSLPTVLALIIGVAAGAALGAAMHLAIMRPLRKRGASPLARVIATLGVVALAIGTANKVLGDTVVYVDPYLPQHSVLLPFDIRVGADRLWMIAISLALFGALGLFYRFHRFGLITTAVASSERIAAAEGHSPDVVATVNWAVGGALAGVAGIIIVPLLGLAGGQMALLVVPALAAALFGNFASFSLTLAGALLIGVLQSEMAYAAPTYPGLSTAVPFAIIIIVLVVRGRGLAVRNYVQDRLPKVGTGLIKPIPIAIALAVALILIFTLNPIWLGTLTTTLVISVIAVSVVVVTGYAGQISLAQYTLAGTGVWFAAWLTQHASIPFPVALLVGALTAIPCGLAFALPALRTRGVTLAIVSLSLAYVVHQVVFNDPRLSGGFAGFKVGEPTFFGWEVDAGRHPARYALIVLAALALCLLVVANLRRGRGGRRLIAVRSNERAAAALGISVFGAKMYAFGLGAAIAGLGGVLLAFRDPNVIMNSFDVFQSINLLLFTVLGGVGFLAGAVVAGLMWTNAFLSYAINQAFGIGAFFDTWGGLLLIWTLLSDPNGVVHALRETMRSLAAALTRGRRAAAAALAKKASTADNGAGAAEVRTHRIPPRTLSVKGLTVRYGNVVAVDDLSFEVGPGQVLGIIGPNGAGKTTSIDAISGYVGYGGTVEVNGESVEGKRAHARAQAGIGRSFQALELFEDMTVIDNLRTASDPRDTRAYLVDLVWPAKAELSSAALAAVHEFQLTDDLEREPGELPHGRRHLVAMARAVAAEPSILLLDEPAAGLDEQESRELAVLIRRLADEWGFTIVLVEHDVSLVRSVSDQIVAIDFGRKIAHGDPDSVCAHPSVVRAYLGEDVPETDDEADLAAEPSTRSTSTS